MPKDKNSDHSFVLFAHLAKSLALFESDEQVHPTCELAFMQDARHPATVENTFLEHWTLIGQDSDGWNVRFGPVRCGKSRASGLGYKMRALTQAALQLLQESLGDQGINKPMNPNTCSYAEADYGSDDTSTVASTVVLTEAQILQEMSETKSSRTSPRRSPRLINRRSTMAEKPYIRMPRVTPTARAVNKTPSKAKAPRKKRLTPKRGKGADQ
ncbi:uncharacterized protein MELLADRAFT_90124 [Melampsora larici-populina 98AG31]|uniref:Uncharacterized protein n=1 Tax=Melampsora larici-populina (strain 98AG31 / pathotype 3-4-7) TaxID=747676 RepID=F4RVS2_MELLP|nr:uncharacterized protein MELLADRAFT_90124 [Melampsora larici-populina 98AG31]EGG03535.1 hypothetical protein MELLADRAFT_90124 [Melampsora larici-populina 98AG31]